MVKQTGKEKHEAAYYKHDLSLLKGYVNGQVQSQIDLLFTSMQRMYRYNCHIN